MLMARRLPRGARRSLTTGETLLAAIGPNPAQLVRRGPSPRRAEALEREWVHWDAEFGFAWRVAAGIPTAASSTRASSARTQSHPTRRVQEGQIGPKRSGRFRARTNAQE